MRKYIMVLIILMQIISMLGVWQVNAAHVSKEYEEGLVVHMLPSFDPEFENSQFMVKVSTDIYIAHIDAFLFSSDRYSTGSMQSIDYYQVTVTHYLLGNSVTETHILATHSANGSLDLGAYYIVSKQWNMDVFVMHNLEVESNNFAYNPTQFMKLDLFDPTQPLNAQHASIQSIITPYI
jgi:hypothetical protein